MSLQYKSGGDWFAIPDAALYSTYGGTYHVDYPPPTAVAVDGTPCGATGKPRIVINSAWMTDTGMGFWRAFFSTTEDTYTAVSIEAWDSRAGAWVKWAGNLKWPTFGSVGVGAAAGSTVYRDVQIEIVECATTA